MIELARWATVITLLASPFIAVTALANEVAWVWAAPSIITLPKRYYTFEPKPDITAYELARATNVLIDIIAVRNPFIDLTYLIDALPPDVKRHFVEHVE